MTSFQPPADSRLATAPRLYVVTPDRGVDDFFESLSTIVSTVDVIVQVRRKSGSEKDIVDAAHKITKLCHESNRLCIINDRVDIAKTVGADGVHLGQTDLAVQQVREDFDGIIGSTCRNATQAKIAVTSGADYLGVGPTFQSSTKPGLPQPLGVDGVAQIAAGVDIPVYAIGGITSDTAPSLIQHGVYGVAVVAAVFNQPDSAQQQAQRLSAVLSAEPYRSGAE